MYIQDQLPWDQVNDENLAFFKAIGVDYLTINPGPDMSDGEDRLEYWRAMKQLAECHGLQLMNTAEHYGVTDIEWDPTGRYVATVASAFRHQV